MATTPIPVAFVCSITQDVLVDPVSTADGHTYSRAAIEHWLADNNTSPTTGAVLAHRNLGNLRRLLEEGRARGHRGAVARHGKRRGGAREKQ